MSSSSKLTEDKKQNRKRKLLIPSKEIQELMEPMSGEEFCLLVKRAIPLSPQSETKAK
jgi:tmRNA-binding protein